MALDTAAPLGPLPCGTLLEDLIAQVTDGGAPLDLAHQAVCHYCQSALEAIREAWEEFQALARSAVTIPGDLGERIMHRVRTLNLVTGEGVAIAARTGATRITNPVLGRLARLAARSVDGVLWASVPGVEEDAERPGSIRVKVRIVAAYGPALPQLAERVRTQVIGQMSDQAGVPVARVDIEVGDLAGAAETS